MSTDNPAITPEELLANAAWLQRLAARLVDPSTADDLVQDTLATALDSPPRAGSRLRPWLATVVRNLVRNRARAARRWQKRSQRIAAADDVPLPTPEDLLAYHQAQRLVAELVAELEEPYRSTVLLCYGQGLSPSEVAGRQSIPAGTVRWRLKQGLDDLRARLDARYRGDRRAWGVALAPLVAARALARATAPVWAVWKLVATVALAAALGLWLGTRRSAAPVSALTPTSGASAIGTGNASAGVGPPRLAAPGSVPSGTPPPARSGPARAVAGAEAPAGPAGDSSPARVEAIRRAMEVGSAPTRGPANAPVTIVTFSEFQGPFCARVQPMLKELLAAYPKEVRLVWRDLPLPFHESSALAAEAAYAAGEQGKFWEMHDRLFAHQEALDPAALTEHARAVGLELAKFQQALDSQKFRKTVEDNARLAKEAGLSGTPSFLVNGKPLVGALPFESFQRMVEQTLGRASPDLPRPPPGTPVPPPPLSAATVERAIKAGSPPSKGEASATVTIVSFSEFQCPFCARVQPTLAQLLAAHPKDLRLVWRNLPLAFHPNSFIAAEAAMAAHEQGKFWQMHDRLFAHQDALDRASLEGHAAVIGLDMQQFKAALDEHRFRKVIEEDALIAEAAAFRGTPAFLIGDARLMGAVPLERFENAFQRGLARAKGLPVPPELPPPPRPPGSADRRFDPYSGAWPPPRVALPDELLGEPARVPFQIGDAPSLGPTRAAVEVLYLVDLGCPFCGRGRTVVNGLHRSYGDAVRIVAIPVPQDPEQPPGTMVAEAAWAAHAQGKFWAIHDLILGEPRGAESREALAQRAKDLGMDVPAFGEALDSGRFKTRVLEDLAKMKDAKLRPNTFIVNGRRAAGTIALVALVDAALKKAGRRPPALPAPAPSPGPMNLDLYEVTVAQRFLLEPRNDAWASLLEKQLTPMIERDLQAIDPSARGLRFECKTQVCRVRWTPGRLGAAAARAFMHELYMGDIAARTPPPTPELYLRARPSGPTGAQEDLVTRLKSRRAGVLYGLRTGRTKIEGLPVDRIPKE